jgi:hypothetical protein
MWMIVSSASPSPEAQKRVAALLELEREEGLQPEEKVELDQFLELEHVLRMAKAVRIRAR